MFVRFLYLTRKLFYLFCIRLLILSRTYSIYMLIEFFFVILECPVLFALLDPDPVSFGSPFFHQYLLMYFFRFYGQNCLLVSFYVFSFHCVFMYYTFFVVSLVVVTLFVFLASFSVQVSSFCSGSYGRYQFYHLLVFAPAQISSFSSVMLSTGIILTIFLLSIMTLRFIICVPYWFVLRFVISYWWYIVVIPDHKVDYYAVTEVIWYTFKEEHSPGGRVKLVLLLNRNTCLTKTSTLSLFSCSSSYRWRSWSSSSSGLLLVSLLWCHFKFHGIFYAKGIFVEGK